MWESRRAGPVKFKCQIQMSRRGGWVAAAVGLYAVTVAAGMYSLYCLSLSWRQRQYGWRGRMGVETAPGTPRSLLTVGAWRWAAADWQCCPGWPLRWPRPKSWSAASQIQARLDVSAALLDGADARHHHVFVGAVIGRKLAFGVILAELSYGGATKTCQGAQYSPAFFFLASCILAPPAAGVSFC